MVRFIALVILALLLALVVRAVVAAFVAGLRAGRVGGARRPLRDELVKDPVCETYVPRGSATVRTLGPTTYYFCSLACAEKFRPAP
jgi:YHS domain-containing protein